MAAEADTTPYGSEARRAKMLERLLQTVEELLDSGTAYVDLSVEAIISHTKIARSTFYAYYDGKGPLLQQLGSDVVTRLIDASSGWSHFPDDGTWDDLATVFADLFGVYRGHSTLLAAMAESSTADLDVRSEFFRMIDTGQSQIRKHVRRGQRTGSVRTDVDATTVEWLVWCLERNLYQLVRGSSARVLPRHVEAFTRIVWSTLYEGARPATAY